MQSGRIPTELDIYIPVYTILQFFFYMGLLKVSLTISKENQCVYLTDRKERCFCYEFNTSNCTQAVKIKLYMLFKVRF